MRDSIDDLFDQQGKFLGNAAQWQNLQCDLADSLRDLKRPGGPTPEELELFGCEDAWREFDGDYAAFRAHQDYCDREDEAKIAAMESDPEWLAKELEFIARQPWIPLGDFERCGSQFEAETFAERTVA